jgi:hypothetical protein
LPLLLHSDIEGGIEQESFFRHTTGAKRRLNARYATHSNGLRYPPSQACQCLSMNELVISEEENAGKVFDWDRALR